MLYLHHVTVAGRCLWRDIYEIIARLQCTVVFGVKCVADEIKSTHRKTACTIGVNMSFLRADDVDVVSLCYVPDDRTLGCRETLHVELKDTQSRADS